MSIIELTRALLPGDKEVCLELQSGVFWDLDVGAGDMFARAIIINVKPGFNLPCALVHHAMDGVRHIEVSAAGVM